MRSNFRTDMVRLLLGCLALLTVLTLTTSCGKDDGTGKNNNNSGYYTHHRTHENYRTRCQVIGASPCGYTLECGRYGRYYCTKNIQMEK